MASSENKNHEAQILPRVEEQAELRTTRIVDSRTLVSRTTVTDEALLETELQRNEVEIKHVEINQPVDENNIPNVRQEGDVLIIPMIEEQVEIIRHHVLKEEVHIHNINKKEPFKQKVILRRQEVTISKDEKGENQT
ncbi:hypothetical protein PMPD1_0559 [Paramixta manurensis]|uniref:DUF2382 domain-containing protein n=1 Tax=Paramixta manurensis TaxID=2740817 RepID=A0A6M8U7N3_9GAMM|nr:hypothetical protein PMPD1_0559 [Erwiniaceae bacterium PD-1]